MPETNTTTKPCPGECGHSDIEHEAFDAGVAAGERGEDELPAKYRDAECVLSEAWFTGNSVGLGNRD